MKTSKFWVMLIGGLFVLSLATAIIIWNISPGGNVANIYLGGQLVYSADLQNVDEPYELTFYGENSYDIVTVEPGRISVSEAGCPDQICVHQGWISDNITPIVCLPNKLVIRIENKSR